MGRRAGGENKAELSEEGRVGCVKDMMSRWVDGWMGQKDRMRISLHQSIPALINQFQTSHPAPSTYPVSCSHALISN